MPVLAIFTGKISKDQYDTVRKEIDSENKSPAGAIFHAVSFDDAGNIHVAEAWDSPETLNAFVQNALMPALQKHNVAPPDVSVFPTHKVLCYSGVEKYRA